MSEAALMARALRLARRGLYGTDPNPRVGCVLVRDGQIVGEGWHRRAGAAHAEIEALAAAGERARGATAYVTLEPCCHQGRTGPCTEALIGAGVKRVVAAMHDPNPAVSGRGLAALERAGLTVEVGLLGAAAEALNPGFVRRMRGGRPWVRVKLAASLDGRTAMADGESRWITGAAARRDGHRLRARSSAVVTGVGTVLADDPRLDARDLEPRDELVQPLRVVLDGALRTPPGARLLAAPGALLACSRGADAGRAAALRAAGAELLELPDRGGRIELAALLAALAERQCNEVLVEAGATLAGAFLEAGLADELIVYLAPLLLGERARPLARLPAIGTMAERLALGRARVRALGDDLRLSYRL